MNSLFGTLPAIERQYPFLTGLMEGYFHQDFHLNGNSVAEVVATWKEDSSADDAQALRLEILSYEQAAGLNVGQAFLRDFRPQVIPSALSGSTENFLREILAAVD